MNVTAPIRQRLGAIGLAARIATAAAAPTEPVSTPLPPPPWPPRQTTAPAHRPAAPAPSYSTFPPKNSTQRPASSYNSQAVREPISESVILSSISTDQ